MNNTRFIQEVCYAIMKATITQLLMTVLLTSLVSAAPLITEGQGILDRKVTLDVNEKEVKTILSEIGKQTSVVFTYNPMLIRSFRKISLKLDSAPLGDVLRRLLDSSIAVVVLEELEEIVLKPKPAADPDLNVPLQLSVTGKVTGESDEPLPGVSILEKGTTNGTITDPKGLFKINVAGKDAVLVFTFVGYISQEVRIGEQARINVALKPDIQSLGETVVVGYGSQKKATLTGSVSQVSGGEIVKSPSPNVSASLQGRLPGLIANQRNGQPGRDDPNIVIRGTGTVPQSGNTDVFNALLSANAPLIVIDGVPRDQLSRLNPEDIESISVLKDASAAIYGARAANGVILVTTRSGSKGKADFTFTYKYALAQPTKIPDVLDAATFAEVYNEGVFYRSGRNPNYIPQYSAEAIQKYRNGSDPVLYPNTDWVKEVLKPHSYQQNLNLLVNGGTNNVRYLISFGALEQNGSFRADPTFYRQYNARIKMDVDLAPNFTIGANVYAILNKRTYSPVITNDNFVNILQANPTLVARYPNGLLGPGRLGQSPLLMDQRGYDKTDDNPLYTTFTASYKVPFIPGLRLDGSFNYDLRNSYTKIWETPYFFYEYNPNTGNYDKNQVPPLTASLRDRSEKWTTMLYNLRITYDKAFPGGHHIGVMAGGEQQQTSYNFVEAYRKNYLSATIPQINQGSASAADKDNAGSAGKGAYNNYFGRLNYDFRSKYLLEFVFRYDGSQIFPRGRRYGFFPGISGGWRLSEEQFMQDAFPFVNQLKIRASYGELGNDRIRAFQFLQTFSNTSYVFGTTTAPGLTSGVLANPDVTWERAKKTDIGLEGQLWKGKFGFDFTWWMQKRRDILAQRSLSIPATFGFPGLPDINFGKVNSYGFEVILSHKNNIGQLSYNLSGNIAYQRSKVIDLDEVPPAEEYQKITGKPVLTDLYYKADGIFHTQEELDKYPHDPNTQVGDIRIADLNGDGVINDNDRYRLDYNAIPRYVFGLNTNFQYKGFDLNVFFQGQTGAYNYDGTVAALGGQDFANSSVWRATDRWTVSNPGGTRPRADAYQRGNTTFYLFDATFVRLKTAELGYSIPGSMLSRTGFIKSLRISISAFNLATWSKDVKWADPEFNGGYLNYPQQRIISFGASVKF